MIEIQIAGAGAGKTFGLSEKLIECNNTINSHKKIYAITYTNSAKIKISQTIIDKLGYIPENINVETVHSFLLNEIIYPYSKYVISEVYNNAVSGKLPEDHKFKNSKKSKLKERNIIHNEDVFKKAKILIDKNNSKHSNKFKKQKVDNIVSHINCKISHIFIDEAQDLDSDALSFFEILGLNAINVYMIGDPKQAIKYPSDFNNFYNETKTKVQSNYNILDNINSTRRIPNNILKVSNLFCENEQIQDNKSTKLGFLYYLTNKNEDYNLTIEYFKSANKLIYIEKKQGIYDTHINQENIYFPLTLEEKLRNLSQYSYLDGDLFIKSLIFEITEMLPSSSVNSILKEFEKKYVKYDKYEYAEFKEILENNKNNTYLTTKIKSIDAVKGLESDVCLFVLNQSMYKYLIKDIPLENYFNKIWKKLYVALTRSSETLILLIDENLFPNLTLNEVIKNIEKLGFTEYINKTQLQ